MSLPEAAELVEGLLSEGQAAKRVHLSPHTLRKWRSEGIGPPFVRVSDRCIRYRAKDLEEFITSRIIQPGQNGGRN